MSTDTRFTILGSGTAVPHPERGPAGYLLEAGDERVLFDAGSGTLQRLKRAGVEAQAIGRVFFTHFHLDHLMDLPTLLFALKNPALDRDRELPVYGPPGLKRIAAGLEDLFGDWVRPRRTRPTWHEIEPGWSATFPFGELRTAETRHVPGSLAFRLDLTCGATLVYTGDTGYSETLVEFSRDADVFVCECSFPEVDPEDLHLSPALAGQMAEAAGVGSLVLTHFYPEVLEVDIAAEAASRYSGKIVLAKDLERIVFEQA